MVVATWAVQNLVHGAVTKAILGHQIERTSQIEQETYLQPA